MGAFFHGWRRKAGVVLLLMACFVTASWIRSIGRVEAAWRNGHVLLHSHGRIVWGRFDLLQNDDGWGSTIYDPWQDSLWRSPLDWEIAHWLLACPLTLLSAYLLLWKPRTKIAIESEPPRR